jgi:hypothetical protein
MTNPYPPFPEVGSLWRGMFDGSHERVVQVVKLSAGAVHWKLHPRGSVRKWNIWTWDRLRKERVDDAR